MCRALVESRAVQYYIARYYTVRYLIEFRAEPFRNNPRSLVVQPLLPYEGPLFFWTYAPFANLLFSYPAPLSVPGETALTCGRYPDKVDRQGWSTGNSPSYFPLHSIRD